MRMLALPHFRRLLALLPVLGLTVAAVLAVLAVVAGCSPNDPFDPNSMPNHPPVVRLAMAPVDPDQELNPTSYFQRTFNWSGTDQDGWVTEFYVSIRTESGVAAPWDTTARTDTTMTFVTDAEGNAEATFLLACRDNRGGVSDTLRQFIPLKNFPPAVNFRSDYDPLVNMQREFRDADGNVTEDPGAAADTTYWNWGAMNFRVFALDLDGAATMDDFYRYTLVDTALGDPDITFEVDDPDADPGLGWVRVPFDASEEIKEFDIFVTDAPVGPATTLTVSVADEADADTRFHFSWEVREPAGPVLYVPDNSGPQAKAFYRDFLNTEYGEGNWAEYSFWFGFPDHAFVLLESFRKFDVVLWADGGTTSPRLAAAAANGGVLTQYVHPLAGEDPGQLLFISRGVVGNSSSLPFPFIQNVLGISPTPDPVTALNLPTASQALGLQPHLPGMATINGFGQGIGLKFDETTFPTTEAIFQMEYCLRCYSVRPPYDPIVGCRIPDRATAQYAEAVTISLPLEFFDPDQVRENLSAVLTQELGVQAP
jgi:hypothetical protein